MNANASPSSSPLTWLTIPNVVWLLVYLATMAGIVWGMYRLRDWSLANLSTAEAREEWNDFRREIKRQNEDPAAPVARRVPKSDEPPTLKLLRDFFGVCVMILLILSSALFAALMLMVRGALGGEKFVPMEDRVPKE